MYILIIDQFQIYHLFMVTLNLTASKKYFFFFFYKRS